MPLGTAASLQTALETFFEDPGNTEAEVIEGWGQIIFDHTENVIPASTATAAARTAFESALAGLSVPNAATAILVAAFTSHAATLAGGMAPAGTPPPSPIVLAPTTALLFDTAALAATAYAPIIDAWYRTGLSGTNPFPPWS